MEIPSRSKPLPNLIPYRSGGLWGYSNSEKEILIKCNYSEAHRFDGDFACVKYNYHYGVIDSKGKEILATVYELPIVFKHDHAILKKDDGFSFLRRDRRIVNLREYKDAEDFNQFNLCKVASRSSFFRRQGFVDTHGSEVIPCAFSAVDPFCQDLAAVNMKGKWGFMDLDGRVIIGCRYNEVKAFSCDFAPVKINDKWGFIDFFGNVVIGFEYLDAQCFSEDRAAVKTENGKWLYIDKSNKSITDALYDGLYPFANGTACAKKGWYFGLLNNQGQELTEFAYMKTPFFDGASKPPIQFAEGLACVNRFTKRKPKGQELWGEFGYIDQNGVEVIPPQFDSAVNFKEGLSWVGKEKPGFKSVNGFINHEGKVVIPFEYRSFHSFNEGLVACTKEGKWGFLNTKGEVAIPLKYKMAFGNFESGLARVDKGYIDSFGTEYWDAEDYGYSD